MALVYYADRLAAVACPACAWMSNHVDVLEPDHPIKRFVAAMCLYAREVETGVIAGPYDHADAAAYARALLMPEPGFGILGEAGMCEVCLAEFFNVPLEQVEERRLELRPTGDPRWVA